MEIFAFILFWLSVLALLHTYFFYPVLLSWLTRKKQNNRLFYEREEDLPFVSVIMSVYNEERVIEAKVESLLGQDYPAGKLRFFVGSDGSTDRTDEILRGRAARHPSIRFYAFTERSGKPGVINKLAALAMKEDPARPGHLFLITDANVMLEPSTLRCLARHFRNDRIAIVDAHMMHTGMKAPGISRAENTYIAGEVLVKHREGVQWGKMIGPFGGCYALRSTFFSPVPSNYLVDDFYIAMKVFEQGGDAINDLDAVCYEAVSHEIGEEYRRKSRISAGNFQNLLAFRHLWWPPVRALSFAFFSHKVLRWLGPFLMSVLILAALVLALKGHIFYRTLLILLMAGAAGALLLDVVLKRWDIHALPLRGIRYFILMNAALFEGFFKFLKGIKSNVWEPPKRN